MSVLVIGGAGFIGSHLVDELLMGGSEVLIIDNLSTGKMENLVRWKGFKNLEFVRTDASDEIVLSRICDHKNWIFCTAPIDVLRLRAIASHQEGVKRVIANTEVGRDLLGDVVPQFVDLVCHDVYGPRGPRTGSLFISDLVVANIKAAMDYDIFGNVYLDHMKSRAGFWSPQIDQEQGRYIIDMYERANPTSSLIITSSR